MAKQVSFQDFLLGWADPRGNRKAVMTHSSHYSYTVVIKASVLRSHEERNFSNVPQGNLKNGV